jgi:hypothetical protein
MVCYLVSACVECWKLHEAVLDFLVLGIRARNLQKVFSFPTHWSNLARVFRETVRGNAQLQVVFARIHLKIVWSLLSWRFCVSGICL